MQNLTIKSMMSINRLILRLSHGRIGSQLGTQTVLILHTRGRRSGQDRAIPIAYFDVDGTVVIVGSNWGKDSQPDWYLNLKKDPHANLEVKGRTVETVAREAEGDEYQRLWDFTSGRNPPYLGYQKMTSRHIPIMIFEPAQR